MIDWNSIDTVLLDMDGTLLDLYFDNYFWTEHLPRIYADKHQISEESSAEHLQRQFQQDEGTLAWYSIDHWSEQLGLDIPALKRSGPHDCTASLCHRVFTTTPQQLTGRRYGHQRSQKNP